MQKIDFKKTLKDLYAPKPGTFLEVDVPEMTFVQVDGAGNPNTTQDYQRAVQALYSVSYAMKFAAKEELDKDYVVPPLEGLWWADDPTAFVADCKDEWRWTMMIMVPDFITTVMYETAREKAEVKLSALPDTLRLAAFHEGPSLQTLHIGSYADEGPTLARLHDEVMPTRGLTYNGHHHEIYISDPRKTAVDRLKTVLRQPVRSFSSAA